MLKIKYYQATVWDTHCAVAITTVLIPDKVYAQLMFPFFVITKHHLLSMS